MVARAAIWPHPRPKKHPHDPISFRSTGKGWVIRGIAYPNESLFRRRHFSFPFPERWFTIPITNGAGHGKWTPFKQERFRAVAGHLVHNAVEVSTQPWVDDQLLFIDLTAGPGFIDGEPGSPVILGRLVRALTQSRALLVFCEKNPDALCDLTRYAREMDGEALRTHIVAGDHQKQIPWSLANYRFGRKSRAGFSYFDANGTDPLPIEVFKALAMDSRTQDLDVLVVISGGRWKRGGRNGELANQLAAIPKKYKFISRERVGKRGDPQGWTFVIASDRPGAQPAHDYVPLFDPAGLRSLAYATRPYTKEAMPTEFSISSPPSRRSQITRRRTSQ